MEQTPKPIIKELASIGIIIAIYFFVFSLASHLAEKVSFQITAWLVNLSPSELAVQHENFKGLFWNTYLILMSVLVIPTSLLLCHAFSIDPLGKLKGIRIGILWLIIGISEPWIISLIAEILNIPGNQELVLAEKTEVFAWLTPIAFLLGGAIMEEMLYRGFICESLKKTIIGVHGAIIVSALLFGIAHFHYSGFEYLTVFIGGILYGYAKAQTGSILIPISMHAAYDLQSWILP